MYEADGNPTNLRHCTVDGCDHPFYARGLCNVHYLRRYRGEPLVRPRRKPLPESFRLFTG